MATNKEMSASSGVTILDVAKASGVSTGTVSRVLNNRSGVRAKTRATVLSTIETLNYQPDPTARELSFRQPTRIGLHIHGIRKLTPFYMLFLENLVKVLGLDGYRLEEIPGRPDGLPSYLTDGVVLFGAHHDDLRVNYLIEQKIPFVLVGHQEGARWVSPDDFTGGLEATQHLLRLGHRDILHVTGGMQGQGEYDRYQGYKAALSQAGVAQQRNLMLDGEFTPLGAYRAVRRALEAGIHFSAVFAASDEMANGTIAALNDLGLSVPADVSVVGFDDLPELGERLTTVKQDISLIAQTAVALLKEGLRGEAVRHEVVPVRLIVRGTTAKRR